MSIRIAFLVAFLAGAASAQDLDFWSLKGMAGDFYQRTQAELAKSQGLFIRTVYQNGCLDSGCCNLCFRQVYHNENCPLWTWLRWSFQGPIMIAHKLFMKMCLDCRDGRPDCAVGTAMCTGKHNQKWNFGLHLNSSTAHGDLLFSIHNHLFPHQCVTIDAANGGGLVLRDCVDPPIPEQLFFVERDWFQAAVGAQKVLDVHQTHLNNSVWHRPTPGQDEPIHEAPYYR